jgi:hypothetical protein
MRISSFNRIDVCLNTLCYHIDINVQATAALKKGEKVCEKQI